MPESRSCPSYGALEADPEGSTHLLAGAGGDARALLPVHTALRTAGADRRTLLCGTPQSGDPAPDEQFADVPALTARFEVLIKDADMGTRVYACGDEAFIWQVYRMARAAHLHPSAIRITRTGPPVRRVFCVHCRAYTTGVAYTLTPCDACGRTLFVRDHFSRRLGAYAGVQADAEAAGDLPPRTALRL